MKNKYLVFIIISFLIFACSQDTNESSSDVPGNSGDGQGGSLATFILKGDYLYTVDFYDLSVFNIKDGVNPVKVNSLNVGFNIETLFGYKDYLFIGSQEAMFIYDISNAELPKKLSQSDHFRSCDPVVANDKNAYVTLHSNASCRGTVNELRTYNIEDIETPILLNTRELTQPKGLSLYGTDYLLVCDESVKIFDVSVPEDSRYIDEIPTLNAIDIVIRNNHAFIISENSIDQYELNAADITAFKKISTFQF